MFVDFSINGISYYFENIIDFDYSFYDEVMVTTVSASEFSVTLALNPLSNADDAFSLFWRDDSIEKQNIEIFVHKTGKLLAGGPVIEWEENKEQATIVFFAKTDIAKYLGENINKNVATQYSFYANWNNNTLINNVIQPWFNELWQQCMPGKAYQFSDPSLATYFYHLANVISSEHYANPRYTLKFTHLLYMTRKDFLKQIAMILNAKISFDVGNNSFVITPFTQYTTAIPIDGYLIKHAYNSQEQVIEDITLFNTVGIYNAAGSFVKSLKDNIIRAVQNQLRNIVRYHSFSIWGYGGKVIVTGQTIELDGQVYYVKDISYDFERLEDIMAFECEGIRFI